MQRLRRVLQPLLLMLALLPELWPQSSPAQQPSPYTEQEKAWIAEHPIIHIAVDPNLRPLEYIENGAYKGLTADYLNAIAQASGLRFVVVPVPQNQLVEALKAGQIDVLPAISPRFTSPRIRDQLIVSAPYFVGGTLIVTRAYGETIFEARNLSGKTVAFKSDGIYEQIFRDQYPDIRTLVVATPDEALAAVAADEADAAIGVDSVLLPILYGKYRNRLHVAGTIADVPAILSMGTTTRLPELAEIIRKSLASLTARQTDAMVERWMTRDIYGAPTWAQILRYRWFEATLIAGTLLLLLLAAFHARHARRAAEKSEQDKARFLAVMSHEIRTPMNAILSSIELLGRSKLTQQQRQLSDLATTASEALLELLDDVLDLSKLEARRLTLTKVPIDMRQLARGVIDIAESSARKKNLDIVLQCDLPPATDLLLDPARVRQILINLTSNAVKFTERGLVQVLISLEGGAEAGRAELPEQALSATLLLVVSDTGIGVPPERQKDLFRPYRQAHQTSTRRFGGTGLGLTICRELCELMGGSIQFSSAADVGTRVTCRIPVELTPAQYGPMEEDEGQEIPVPPNNPHAPADSHAKENGGASGAEDDAGDAPASPGQSHPPPHIPHILAVEDHPGNRMVLRQQLTELGYRFTIVNDGRSALAQTARRGFSLMLLDCYLPDIDGYAVAAQQRAREAGHSHLPIIAISAAVDQEHLDACLNSGMDGTLRKPLRLAALEKLLNAWCGPGKSTAGIMQTLAGVKNSGANHADNTDPNAVFIQATRDDLADLTFAVRQSDRAAAARIAHRIRGAALVCRWPDIAARMSEIEHELKTSAPTDKIADLIARVHPLLAAKAG